MYLINWSLVSVTPSNQSAGYRLMFRTFRKTLNMFSLLERVAMKEYEGTTSGWEIASDQSQNI